MPKEVNRRDFIKATGATLAVVAIGGAVKLGKAARKTVVEQFNWDRSAEGIAESLRTVKR